MKGYLLYLVALCCWGALWLSCGSAQAGPLADRLAAFPDWQSKPPVHTAKGDLIYPDWFEGDWQVTSTLIDLAAPLAPAIATPGFEANRQRLNQPLTFPVRFIRAAQSKAPQARAKPLPVVADRSFNGLSLARASLGDRMVLAVKTDPTSANRQITLLRGDRQLISTVRGRAVEAPNLEQFITTELFQQVFRGTAQPYFNEVESTTAYQHQTIGEHLLTADQVTAIYLSPQDTNYFRAGNTPVALYRYRLEFFPAKTNME